MTIKMNCLAVKGERVRDEEIEKIKIKNIGYYIPLRMSVNQQQQICQRSNGMHVVNVS